MEKSVRIILYILVGITLINFLVSFFGSDNIKSIRRDLQKAKQTADSALTELQFSRNKLDSIKSDMLVFRSYINRIENTVALNDAEKRLREERDAAKVKDLKEEIRKRREELENDSLPDIDVITKK
jgi:septal ring factor EnvC (AmiA/AmiB activator)